MFTSVHCTSEIELHIYPEGAKSISIERKHSYRKKVFICIVQQIPFTLIYIASIKTNKQTIDNNTPFKTKLPCDA